MNGEIIIHERENNEVSESFLKANGKKFGNDCVRCLRLLYTGNKYTAKEINDELNMADGGRRLREIFAQRNDCKRQKRYTDGKLEGMEYWLEIPGYPTKGELQTWWNEFQQEKPKTETPIRYMKGKPNASDFAKNIITIGKQINLF